MNKQEILNKIEDLLIEADMSKETARANNDKIEQAIAIGKVNGLLWAKMLLMELEEKE